MPSQGWQVGAFLPQREDFLGPSGMGKGFTCERSRAGGAPSVVPKENGPSFVPGGSARPRWDGGSRTPRWAVAVELPKQPNSPQGLHCLFQATLLPGSSEGMPEGLLRRCQAEVRPRGSAGGKPNVQGDAEPRREELRCGLRGVSAPRKKAFWAPPGRQTLRTRGQVFPSRFMGCALDLRAKRAGTTQMYFCLPVPLHPKAKSLRSPWKFAPAFAVGCGCGAHAGAISSGLPQQTARPSRNIVFPISEVQSARRAVGATSPPRPPSYRSQGDTRALTRAPSTERPWQGETLLPPPRWVHTLYGQRCDPGGMLRPPMPQEGC